MQNRLNQFIENLNGQFVEVSYRPAEYQCMDLAYLWVFVLGYPKATIQHLYAYQVYTKPNSLTKKYFDLIPNTPNFIPEDGDIAVFDKTSGNIAGHIAICLSGGTLKTFRRFEQNSPLGTHSNIRRGNYTTPKLLGVLRPKIFDLSVSPEAPEWLRTMFQEIDIDLKKPESDIRSKVDNVIKAYRERPELVKQLEIANKKTEGLITDVSQEREKAKKYKKLYDDFVVYLAQKLGVPAEEVEIKSEVENLIDIEDQVTELEGTLKKEHKEYKDKLKVLSTKAGTLQNQVNILINELEDLQEKYPELPIKIPVEPRRLWNRIVDTFNKILDSIGKL